MDRPAEVLNSRHDCCDLAVTYAWNKLLPDVSLQWGNTGEHTAGADGSGGLDDPEMA